MYVPLAKKGRRPILPILSFDMLNIFLAVDSTDEKIRIRLISSFSSAIAVNFLLYLLFKASKSKTPFLAW